MKIGELAEWAKCPAVTIRYYEKIGLLSGEKRDRLNHRIYDKEDIARLRLILHCRNHGIPMKDIRILLDLRTRPENSDTEARNIIRHQIKRLTNQRESLNELIGSLSRLLDTDEEGDAGGKGIIDTLESPCPYCRDYKEDCDSSAVPHRGSACLVNPAIRKCHDVF